MCVCENVYVCECMCYECALCECVLCEYVLAIKVHLRAEVDTGVSFETGFFQWH